MDARETLRRYLEQRRDLGESEFVLDSLSVDEALKMLGAASLISRASETESLEFTGARGERGAPPPLTTDWRSALRDSGAAATRPAAAAHKPVSEPAPSAATAENSEADEPPAVPVKTTIPRYAFPAPDPARVGEVAARSAASSLSEVPTGLSAGGERLTSSAFVSHLMSLEEVAEVVAGCRRCPLYATAINPVPGSGNATADFMIVGEAPGASEDEQGVPFVGAAGQLLTKIIEAIDLKREEVFIANVLKHRPPGNRNPLPDEVLACSPYLIRQIELVQPKVILALGTFAAQTLLETKLTIGKLRGQIHRYHGVPLVVTYHPAALLRNPSWKRPTWEDVKLARRIFDSTVSPGA